MKPLPSILAVLALSVLYSGLSACQPGESPDIAESIPDSPANPPDNGDAIENETENENPQNDQNMNRKITVRAGHATFTATLEDNETAQAFARMLPMTVDMTELNRNEKYCDLPESLPTQAVRPDSIRTGDLLLWGSHTVVLFYKTFKSSYSYTRIGKIDQPQGLEVAVGTGDATVTFEPIETHQ